MKGGKKPSLYLLDLTLENTRVRTDLIFPECGTSGESLNSRDLGYFMCVGKSSARDPAGPSHL